MTHADRPAHACDWASPTNASFRCTLPAGHHGPHLMHRDLAVAWWGTKATHRWGAAELKADRAA